MKRILQITLFVMIGILSTQCASQMRRTDGGKNANLRSVYFDYDKDYVREDQVPVMQSNAAYLKKAKSGVVIEGYCDPRGTNEYNLALGQRRAQAARDYLANLGVNTSKMRTVSYGEERLVCQESSEDCWQRNRRADFRK